MNIAALAEDLERFLDDRPILARPISRLDISVAGRVIKPEVVAISLTASLLIAVTVSLSSRPYFFTRRIMRLPRKMMI